MAEQLPEFGVMDATEWAGFDAVVRDVMRSMRIDIERYEPGAIVLRGRGTFGLLNVAQLCHANPPGDWPQILERHFEAVLGYEPSDLLFNPGRLRVRLFPDDYFTPKALALTATRPYAANVVAGIVVDLPTRVQSVSREQLTAAQYDEEASWNLSWNNTRAAERPDQYEVLDINGAAVHSLFGQSFFVASLVQYLPDIIGPIGSRGAVVSIPRRHSVLAHVIEDSSPVRAVRAMLPLTRTLFAEGPGSVSAHLYWWHDRELRRVSSAAIGNAAVRFHPPDYCVTGRDETGG